MAYLAPIHRPSSIRHALKLNLLTPEEDCLVVAYVGGPHKLAYHANLGLRKSNVLELYTQTADGLSLQHSKTIYGKITMLQKLRPPLSSTDHLFVGTDRYMYFTLVWNPEKKQLQTEKTFQDVADNAARESQTGERCLVDPSGRFMTLEIYEGIITVITLVQRGKKRKQESDIAQLGEPQPCRVDEMFVRSSAFLRPRALDDKPKLALLYEDTNGHVRLKMRELSFAGSDAVELDDGESYRGDLELGASHLIPIEEPTRKYAASTIPLELLTCVRWTRGPRRDVDRLLQ
jgi:DNA damage-binding protein 1